MEQHEMMPPQSTIAAVSTPAGTGGIAVIRVSGPQAVAIVNAAWKGKNLDAVASHTAHLGSYISTDGKPLDEAVATIFRAPASFTGEDVVELSVHGSRWIQREVVADLIRRGANPAAPGEFTQRAFMNGKLDLAQAEAVADLIASSSKAAHSLAINQMKGNFSREIDTLRDKLTEFAALLELELDFSEEDVEFADRTQLTELASAIISRIDRLAASFSSGAVLKDGVPVVIAGIPNAGKSSVLNLLLGDDKAIVSDIPGTTRDTIEDTVEINGVLFRFIDTAGLHETSDTVEAIGIDRARSRMSTARIVIWVIDPLSDQAPQLAELNAFRSSHPSIPVILLTNKSDLSTLSGNSDSSKDSESSENSKNLNCPHNPDCSHNLKSTENPDCSHNLESTENPDCSHNLKSTENMESTEPICFSAKTAQGLEALHARLHDLATQGHNPDSEILITNIRHYQALTLGADSLRAAVASIQTGESPVIIAQDIRQALHHLSSITGTISSTTLLNTIFSRFCIGK